MGSTTETREIFPKANTPEGDVKELVRLRMKAGAITSVLETEGENWVVVSVWNVFDEQ